MDLHISPTSPLEGKGKVHGLTSVDIDGQRRVTSSYDIGADDTAHIRRVVGNYIQSVNCPVISGNQWIDVTDTVVD